VQAVNLENVRRDDWLVGGTAVVLAFDLLVFAWFSLPSASLTIGGTTVAFGGGSLTATDTPDGWLGVLAVIALLALIADLALERFSPETHVPMIGESRAMSRYVLAIAAATLMALKFIFHLGSFANLGLGFWLGAILAGALVYFTMQSRQAQAVTPVREASATTPAGSARSGGSPPP
jgi:hypothetical protein